jgi:hypothetical protein
VKSAAIDELYKQLLSRPEGLPTLVSRLGFVPLLAFLEFPKYTAAPVLRQLAVLLPSAFPLPESADQELVRWVLANEELIAVHWAGKALGWIEDAMPISQPLASELHRFATESRQPQAIRHRAMALFAAWKQQQMPKV